MISRRPQPSADMFFQKISQSSFINGRYPRIDLIHLGLIHINTRNLMSFLGKADSRHDPDVTRSYDRNLHATVLPRSEYYANLRSPFHSQGIHISTMHRPDYASGASRFSLYQISDRLRPSSKVTVGLYPICARAFIITGQRLLGLSIK